MRDHHSNNEKTRTVKRQSQHRQKKGTSDQEQCVRQYVKSRKGTFATARKAIFENTHIRNEAKTFP